MTTFNYNFRYFITRLYQPGSTPNPVIAELPFTGVNFTQQLNSAGTFQGHVLLSGLNATSMNLYDSTTPGLSILWIVYSDSEEGYNLPVWSGVIWQRDYNSTTQSLSISAQEMISLYNRRRISVTKNYTSPPKDPTYIAKDLLQYAESKTHGNTGLQYASVPSSGVLTTKTYNGYELKSVNQAIKDLSQNYFDYKISPEIDSNGNLINKFYMGCPLGQIYQATNPLCNVLQLPGNIIEYNFPEDAGSAANVLYGLGTGYNNSKIIVTATSTDYITSGSWPLLEDTASYNDIPDTNLVKDLTLGQLKATAYPPTTVQVVLSPYVDPVYPIYNIGDEIRLDIKDDYFPNGLTGLVLRIVGISVNPGENGPARVTLTLTRQLTQGTVS